MLGSSPGVVVWDISMGYRASAAASGEAK